MLASDRPQVGSTSPPVTSAAQSATDSARASSGLTRTARPPARFSADSSESGRNREHARSIAARCSARTWLAASSRAGLVTRTEQNVPRALIARPATPGTAGRASVIAWPRRRAGAVARVRAAVVMAVTGVGAGSIPGGPVRASAGGGGAAGRRVGGGGRRARRGRARRPGQRGGRAWLRRGMAARTGLAPGSRPVPAGRARAVRPVMAGRGRAGGGGRGGRGGARVGRGSGGRRRGGRRRGVEQVHEPDQADDAQQGRPPG